MEHSSRFDQLTPLRLGEVVGTLQQPSSAAGCTWLILGGFGIDLRLFQSLFQYRLILGVPTARPAAGKCLNPYSYDPFIVPQLGSLVW